MENLKNSPIRHYAFQSNKIVKYSRSVPAGDFRSMDVDVLQKSGVHMSPMPQTTLISDSDAISAIDKLSSVQLNNK